MNFSRKISSVKAWFFTGSISVLTASVIFLSLYFTVGGGGSGAAALYVLGICEAVHIVSYSIIGLPFFGYYWSRVESPVWRIHYALLLGFAIGYLAMLLFIFIYSGFDLSWNDEGVLFGCLLGGIYGLGTALISWGISNWSNKIHT